VDEDEVEEGEILSCPECESELEVTQTHPVHVNPISDDLDDEEDEEEEDDEVEERGRRRGRPRREMKTTTKRNKPSRLAAQARTRRLTSGWVSQLHLIKGKAFRF
jgi:alpha-aminoadipate carrier protein LysW